MSFQAFPDSFSIMSSKFKLQVWGPLDSLVTYSPECQAAIWYLGLVGADFTVVQSSNNLRGKLPVLTSGDHTVYGFTNIIRFLKSTGFDLDINLSEIQKAKAETLLVYINSHVGGLSQYILFVQRDNFEAITRPLISKLLPFPMQYSAAIYERERAKSECQALGITGDVGGVTAASKNSAPNPALSNLQKQLEEKRTAQSSALETAKQSLKALNFANEVYKTVEEYIGSQLDTQWLFGESFCTCDLLLIAHLQVQTVDFPVPVIKTLLDNEFKGLKSYFERGISELNQIEYSLTEVPPRDIPSFLNYVKSWINT